MQQNYANHKRLHPIYHFIFTTFILVVLVGSIVNLVQTLNQDVNPLSAILLFLVSVLFTIILAIIRSYPLKAQDRAIQAEEGLRHFMLTGKRLNTNLTHSQILALRFASDAEFPVLCERAAAEKLSNDAIKKAIVAWRADHFRI
jgi:4-hydroxybenzoate polyprenyltransferase